MIHAWVGNVSGTGATVKAFADPLPSPVDLQFSTDPGLVGAATVIGVVGADDVVVFELAGLVADTVYHFGFDGAPPIGRFRTFPLGQASFTIAAGGDTGSASDYPGPTATSNSIAFDRIRERDPLLFIHLGDLHYRNLNTTDPAAYRTAYRDVLSNARFSELVRSVASDYIWDDHDYGPNDSDGTYVGKATVQQVYREHVPHWPLPSPSGAIYHTFVIGRVRFIFLDPRSGRTPNADPDDIAKSRLGTEQKQWLKDILLDADEPVIVLDVGSWIGETTGFADGWDSFSTERTELFDFFVVNGLMDRLLLIGADIHELQADDGTNTNFATGATEPGPPFVGLAPLDSTFNHFAATPQNTYQLSKQQYGTLEFVDSGDLITVTVRGWVCAADGSEAEIVLLERAFVAGFGAALSQQAIEAWVTTPAGDYIAHLDRSPASPFRAFRFYRERLTDGPGGGSLEYHLDNALVRGLAVGSPEIPGNPEQSYHTAIEVLGPVAWWRLGEAAGATVAEDASGNGRDGTYVGSPTLGAVGLLTGDVDTAVDFDGVDDYLTATGIPATNAFTLAAIVHPTLNQYSLFVGTNTQPVFERTSTGACRIYWRDSSGMQRSLAAPGFPLVLNETHSVVATHDGTTARLYIDGVEVASTSAWDCANLASTMHIGARNGASFFEGRIDEPAIFDRALTADEIAALYAAGTTAPMPATDPTPAVPSVDLFAKGNLVWMRYRGRLTTWIVEEDTSQITTGEHGDDWVAVAGAGDVQLLADRIVFPPDFGAGANLNPQTWATQWRHAVNRAAGELLWDLIEESNARFATQIVRGTVQSTGADGITVDHRFENLLDDVVAPVLELHGGSVIMEGLEFNYYTDHGTDRREEVIFEEGADLLSLRATTSERESVSWVVGEGVGEGVFAKLAVASNPGAARRREAFLAAKEAGNLPLLQLMTDAALAENGPVLALELDVDESRYRALVDYELDDIVRVICPSRDVDKAIEVVSIYVGEDGDRVRVSVDLGLVREDDQLRLDRQLRKTRRALGVRDRQPQGQITHMGTNGADVFDSTDTMDVLLDVLEEVYVLVRARVTIHFRQFFAPASAAAAASAGTSGSGGSSSPTSAGGGAHNHRMFQGGSMPPISSEQGFLARVAAGGDYTLVIKSTIGATDIYTRDAAATHQHSVTIPAHDHTVPGHGHALTYGVFKEAFPASHSVNLGIYHWDGSGWDLVVSISGLTDVVEEVDVTQYVDGPGLWRFSLQSAAGQPQGGRLAADVSVAVLGAIQSA